MPFRQISGPPNDARDQLAVTQRAGPNGQVLGVIEIRKSLGFILPFVLCHVPESLVSSGHPALELSPDLAPLIVREHQVIDRLRVEPAIRVNPFATATGFQARSKRLSELSPGVWSSVVSVSSSSSFGASIVAVGPDAKLVEVGEAVCGQDDADGSFARAHYFVG